MPYKSFANDDLPPTRKKRKEEDTNYAEWKKTHTVIFSEEEIGYIMEALEEPQPNMIELLKEFADEGIRISIKFNRRKKLYELRIFRDDPSAGDAGYAIVVQAQSIERTMAGFLFAMKDVNDFNLAALVEIRERTSSAF